ncbi:hypothetical protein BCIN_03g04370 [Botrytis cinerea B05.10]|uniref:Enoyl reductase (ER) domain-containing protein n=3 Tax=Botryotinia fuckeliana TaxID=40559 RepID=A0A384JCQ2_BOTFB|nr:hypothetical protein BCIN_03g04370 [Botrytis cinerea B05.10]ATZ48197.1 hypothetical protein BCIN_03g04370 [Botrytis cinerea B05.10]EMR83179.1 putative alcohol dehydrogenase protein [Botrytis cinerea BcDW1]CCD51720.1 similar to zinc-binding oxidoreductase ToxD [Botrytis cinerea T4]
MAQTTPNEGILSLTIPALQNALVASGPGKLVVSKSIKVPDIKEDQVLVQVKAVALNPSDWKILDRSYTSGAIAGADFSGIVCKVGNQLSKDLHVGDRVCGAIFGSNPLCPSNGAFAEYLAATGNLCMLIPSSMSFASAASLGIGTMTVGLALRSLGILPSDLESLDSLSQKVPKSAADEHPFAMVYGASTATGTLAVQCLGHLGYRPIALCSPRNFKLVKERGAFAVFDYAESQSREEIRELTKGDLTIALDCITTSKSTTMCYGAIGCRGGRYTALESIPARLNRRRADVKPEWILALSVFGEPVHLAGDYYREAAVDDHDFAAAWIQKVEELLKLEKLIPHPMRTYRTGLKGIVAGLDRLRKGEVSGCKEVYMLGV